MIEIDIPGRQPLHLHHLVLDFNGTLACDGRLLAGVGEALTTLAQQLEVHVLTADTHGSAGRELAGLPCTLAILAPEQQDRAKESYLKNLPPASAAAIGNGRNDRLMLQAAALGIAVIQTEGSAVATLQAAEVVVPDIACAFDLLLTPRRLVATLRN